MAVTDPRQAVELRLAGASFATIAVQLGYATPDVAAEVIRLALGADGPETAEDRRRLYLERIDAMVMGLWSAARRGDVGAVDRVLKLIERRAEILGESKGEPAKPEGGRLAELREIRANRR